MDYQEVQQQLMKVVALLKNPEDMSEALAIYLVGCAVSVLQEPTEKRRQLIFELLAKLVKEHT